jgi:hypothetical protein
MKQSQPILRLLPTHLLRRSEEEQEKPQSKWPGSEAFEMTVSGIDSVCWLVVWLAR